jgi:sterol desaturase/sphingolipid hydroxylase (fatty acid hydroxylase superfamily)
VERELHFEAMHRVIPFLVVYVGLAVLFGFLERVAPAIPRRRRSRTETRTDLVYWLFTPVVTRAIGEGAVVVTLAALAIGVGHARDKAGIAAFVHHHSVLAQQPRILQLFELLFLADLSSYWAHRLFHRGGLWAFHAVHHSSDPLDWLSAIRVHPVNEVLSKLAIVLPLLPFGFDLHVTMSVGPVLALYAVFVHANVRWDFGPLRYVIATPVFHRWHHSSEAAGVDKNFAGLFPVIDLVFGTFYLPRGQQPARFGVPGLAMPSGLLGQLVYPFRRPGQSAA